MQKQGCLPHYTLLHSFLLEPQQGRALFFRTTFLSINHPKSGKEKDMSGSRHLPSQRTPVLGLWVRKKEARGEEGQDSYSLCPLCWPKLKDRQAASSHEELAVSKGKEMTCPPALWTLGILVLHLLPRDHFSENDSLALPTAKPATQFCAVAEAGRPRGSGSAGTTVQRPPPALSGRLGAVPGTYGARSEMMLQLPQSLQAQPRTLGRRCCQSRSPRT